jgi:hypothetical protein
VSPAPVGVSGTLPLAAGTFGVTSDGSATGTSITGPGASRLGRLCPGDHRPFQHRLRLRLAGLRRDSVRSAWGSSTRTRAAVSRSSDKPLTKAIGRFTALTEEQNRQGLPRRHHDPT